MKKRIIAMIALVLVLSMSTITVSASSSPSGGNNYSTPIIEAIRGAESFFQRIINRIRDGLTLSGDLMMVSGEGSEYYIYRLKQESDVITESREGTIGIQTSSDEELISLSELTLNRQRTKMFELANEAILNGIDLDGIGYDLTATGDNLTITFIDPRIEESDLANGLVRVFHLKEDGTWEEPSFLSYDGGVIVTYEGTVGPTLIVKYTQRSDYSTKPGTISGDVTSPKTGSKAPFVTIVIAIISLAGIVLFSRKLAKR